jgi:hypothetical protein
VTGFCCPLDVVVVLLDAVVVVDEAPVAAPGSFRWPVVCDVAAPAFCVERTGGLSEAAMNVTEPRRTMPEPRTAHDHHTR